MKSSKNVVIAAVTAVVLAIAVLLYASPYIAMHSIKKAMDAQDADALAQYVDFPVLRENLKGKMMSTIANRLPQSEDPSNPLGGIGQALGSIVVGAAVDNLVSPAGVMMLMQTGQFGPKVSQSKPAQNDGAASEQAKGNDERSFSLTYQGFSKVRVFRKSQPGSAFIFRRDGLMGWKLVNVDT
ncbi:DUF2939 domain-containing protein [Diaphorobacter caeni]|uniref:DUF2939 domain-containing protein n=1 Tax=Diaphorobacter caeni TaxID=2784387 RepID=UPI00188EA072|nr:DUF2939 domain-containing protein [Diaphorobacter caeni]MBF5004837.1 DUF2939 domain-containing protein [Diaphorobacter caeni]